MYLFFIASKDNLPVGEDADRVPYVKVGLRLFLLQEY